MGTPTTWACIAHEDHTRGIGESVLRSRVPVLRIHVAKATPHMGPIQCKGLA